MNHLFAIHADITRLAADAIVYSTTRGLHMNGLLYASFSRADAGFEAACTAARERTKTFAVGDAFVIGACAPGDGGAGARQAPVVIGVIALTSESRRADYVAGRVVPAMSAVDEIRAAVTGSVSCAVEVLRAAGRKGRLLVVVPLFLQGLGGGRHQSHALVEAQVRATLVELDRHEELDIALAAYTDELYRVLLDARRKVTPVAPMTVPRELVAAFRAREGVLFVGSGVSLPADLPGWSDLIQELREQLELARDDHDGVDDFLDLAQWHRENIPASAVNGLGKVVGALFGRKRRPTLAHYLLLALGARTLITTNYDRLLEEASIGLGHQPHTIVDAKDVPRAIDEDQRAVVKLHGDAERPDSIVLSRDDYDHFETDHQAMALLVQGLLLTRTFLFVGYSLRDPDFRRLHARIARMLGESQRKAHATTFDRPKLHAITQWDKKNVSLVPLEPTPDHEGALARWLDGLVDAVRAEPVLLAPAVDMPATPDIAALREHLCHAGEALERAVESVADARQAHLVAQGLEALVQLGWKPNGRRLWELWKILGERAGAPERTRLLRRALAATESAGARELVESLLATPAVDPTSST